MEDARVNLNLEVPFPNSNVARIAHEVLRVDKEPKRSGVVRTLEVKDNVLHAHFEAPSARQLRISSNGFLDKIILMVETIESFGPPVSETYDHY
ncbi:uncharacterized protein LOC109607437 [Aethina tumida]|uniref:uncharacterized protein LOC109607437 n=1 Tax=Aethina tumida TaxID=116153 RepID=UPI0021493F20|nr:uncharacterized protein LOC109607437 [Aethina tumida]